MVILKRKMKNNIFSEDFLHYLSGFHFSGDIYAIPEGTVVFPKEPLIKVVAPIMEAQLIETAILNGDTNFSVSVMNITWLLQEFPEPRERC